MLSELNLALLLFLIQQFYLLDHGFQRCLAALFVAEVGEVTTQRLDGGRSFHNSDIALLPGGPVPLPVHHRHPNYLGPSPVFGF